MNDIKDSEQWLTEGNCKKCRRSNYCSKSCKAHKKEEQAFVFGACYSALAKRSPTAASVLMYGLSQCSFRV